MNIYETTHAAQCPNGLLNDHYEIKIESSTTIQVEHILKTLGSLPERAYQEEIADILRAKMGASVTVTGWHFSVKITCYRP